MDALSEIDAALENYTREIVAPPLSTLSEPASSPSQHWPKKRNEKKLQRGNMKRKRRTIGNFRRHTYENRNIQRKTRKKKEETTTIITTTTTTTTNNNDSGRKIDGHNSCNGEFLTTPLRTAFSYSWIISTGLLPLPAHPNGQHRGQRQQQP